MPQEITPIEETDMYFLFIHPIIDIEHEPV